MKPALLDSIYNKLNSEDQSSGLQNNAKAYAKKVLMQYLQILDKADVTNLKEKVKVQTKFPDGYVLNSVYPAGYHIITLILESPEFEDFIKPLDEKFLENCDCSNKEEILMYLKNAIIDVADESTDQKDWMKAIDGFNSCDDIPEDQDFDDED